MKSYYVEDEFKYRLDSAMKRIRLLLDNTRNPRLPADVPHQYEDKYRLAEWVASVSVASWIQCLEVIGMSADQLTQLREWAKTRAVSLRFAAQEDCRFVREETRKVESADERVTEVRGLLGSKITKSEKVVTTVTEYFWAFDFKYEIVAFQGTSTETQLTLHSRSGSVEIKTGAKTTPRPQTVVRSPLDVNATWILGHLDAESRASVTIDRAAKSCHTPRRNDEIDAAFAAFDELHLWCVRLTSYFLNELFPAQQEHGLDLEALHAGDVFVPVVPVFEEPRAGDAGQGAGGVLPSSNLNTFLAEERRSLFEKCRALGAAFPKDGSVITAVEACLLVTLRHAQQVCRQFANGVDYIEDMLRKQLVAAIGKEVTPADFGSYMDFHHRKLVASPFRPQPFSYAVRRPEHDPEGVISIEQERGSALPDCISTTVARSEARRPMTFPLDASTRVSFLGDRYLHGWISHQFSGQKGPDLSLVARARQFSSFILLVGRIASADVFEPRFGIIVQNKDLLKIPLSFEQIPTPKEFRDAIESLSPEQQRFARAFRGMQLESTLFGVCILQIKPQLEKLLKLPPDSLTKEIKLTQALLSLFIELQIPSDLLSYDGPEDASTAEKLTRVREYAIRMQEMLDQSKKRELEEEQEREAMRLAEQNRTPYPTFVAMAAPGMGPPGMGPPGMGPPGMGPPPMPSSGPPMLGGAPPPMARSMAMASSAAAAPPAMAPSPPAPPPAQSQTAAPVASHSPRPAAASQGAPMEGGDLVDYTRIPGELDRRLEKLDEDAALRATIINPGQPWSRTRQKGLLGAPNESTVFLPKQKEEKNRAFDLVDALSKSGALPFEDASLHVVIAATHCFDRTLLDTVIQDNVNPIEKVERSLMIMATTIHGRPASELLADDQRERFFSTSPRLGPPGSDESGGDP